MGSSCLNYSVALVSPAALALKVSGVAVYALIGSGVSLKNIKRVSDLATLLHFAALGANSPVIVVIISGLGELVRTVANINIVANAANAVYNAGLGRIICMISLIGGVGATDYGALFPVSEGVGSSNKLVACFLGSIKLRNFNNIALGAIISGANTILETGCYASSLLGYLPFAPLVTGSGNLNATDLHVASVLNAVDLNLALAVPTGSLTGSLAGCGNSGAHRLGIMLSFFNKLGTANGALVAIGAREGLVLDSGLKRCGESVLIFECCCATLALACSAGVAADKTGGYKVTESSSLTLVDNITAVNANVMSQTLSCAGSLLIDNGHVVMGALVLSAANRALCSAEQEHVLVLCIVTELNLAVFIDICIVVIGSFGILVINSAVKCFATNGALAGEASGSGSIGSVTLFSYCKICKSIICRSVFFGVVLLVGAVLILFVLADPVLFVTVEQAGSILCLDMDHIVSNGSKYITAGALYGILAGCGNAILILISLSVRSHGTLLNKTAVLASVPVCIVILIGFESVVSLAACIGVGGACNNSSAYGAVVIVYTGAGANIVGLTIDLESAELNLTACYGSIGIGLTIVVNDGVTGGNGRGESSLIYIVLGRSSASAGVVVGLGGIAIVYRSNEVIIFGRLNREAVTESFCLNFLCRTIHINGNKYFVTEFGGHESIFASSATFCAAHNVSSGVAALGTCLFEVVLAYNISGSVLSRGSLFYSVAAVASPCGSARGRNCGAFFGG